MLTEAQHKILKALGDEVKTTGDLAREVYGTESSYVWTTGKIMNRLHKAGYVEWVTSPDHRYVGWKKRAVKKR